MLHVIIYNIVYLNKIVVNLTLKRLTTPRLLEYIKILYLAGEKKIEKV